VRTSNGFDSSGARLLCSRIVGSRAIACSCFSPTNGVETTLPVLIVFPDVDTDPGGKLCTTCDHHYNKAVQVTTGWQRFTVNFADLLLESGTVPEPTAFKPDGLISVQFRMAPGQSYELFVDELAFLKAN
jgi:hypothetical protein